MKIITLFLVLLSFGAKADTLYLGMWSHHYTWDGECFEGEKCVKKPNATHNLVMYERGGYEIGTYYNSYYEQSVFVMKKFHLGSLSDNILVDGHFGFVTGYRNQPIMSAVTFAYVGHTIEPVLLLTVGVAAVSFRVSF